MHERSEIHHGLRRSNTGGCWITDLGWPPIGRCRLC